MSAFTDLYSLNADMLDEFSHKHMIYKVPCLSLRPSLLDSVPLTFRCWFCTFSAIYSASFWKRRGNACQQDM